MMMYNRSRFLSIYGANSQAGFLVDEVALAKALMPKVERSCLPSMKKVGAVEIIVDRHLDVFNAGKKKDPGSGR